MNKNILIISQYFYPEQFRINDICLEWVARGYNVNVVTGIPNYPKGKYYEGYGLCHKRQEIYKGINIIRLPIVPRGNNSIMLVLNYISFVISGIIWKTFTNIKADFVFIFELSPMTQALPGIWYASKEKIPCYLYVQDLWPESVEIITGIKNRYIIGAIGRMADYIYSKSTKIFTTSKSFVQSINERQVPLNKIAYWPQYAEDYYKPLSKTKISEIPDDGAFNIIFTGNIGIAQGLDILIGTATLLKSSKLKRKVRFNIVGDGRYKETLVKLAANNNISDLFNFIPQQEARRIPELMAACDTAFLSLVKSQLFAKTIPAKLQSYLACGIPIIASAEGETRDIIHSAKAGLCCKPGDVEELANLIVEMSCKSQEELANLGNNARNYYLQNFSKSVLLDKMDQYFI